MIIYHSDNARSKIFNDLKRKRKRKNVKKEYKSIDNQEQRVIRAKPLGVEDSKKSKKLKKKLSKINIQFLEGLGLKVNQNIDSEKK